LDKISLEYYYLFYLTSIYIDDAFGLEA